MAQFVGGGAVEAYLFCAAQQFLHVAVGAKGAGPHPQAEPPPVAVAVAQAALPGQRPVAVAPEQDVQVALLQFGPRVGVQQLSVQCLAQVQQLLAAVAQHRLAVPVAVYQLAAA